jgi:hypothetical protein
MCSIPDVQLPIILWLNSNDTRGTVMGYIREVTVTDSSTFDGSCISSITKITFRKAPEAGIER